MLLGNPCNTVGLVDDSNVWGRSNSFCLWETDASRSIGRAHFTSFLGGRTSVRSVLESQFYHFYLGTWPFYISKSPPKPEACRRTRSGESNEELILIFSILSQALHPYHNWGHLDEWLENSFNIHISVDTLFIQAMGADISVNLWGQRDGFASRTVGHVCNIAQRSLISTTPLQPLFILLFAFP